MPDISTQLFHILLS